MNKTKREIIALVLLVVLLVAGLGFFGWYITTGHKWNVAATTIDDMTGNMDGYVVLLYEGTDTPDGDAAKSSGIGDDAADSSATILANARKSYRDKGATVFSLRTGTYSYTEPFVLLRNDYRVGFLPVEKDTPYLTIDRQIALLQQRGADIIVALEYSENEYIESVNGVDVILELGVTPTEQESTDDSQADGSANDGAGDSASASPEKNGDENDSNTPASSAASSASSASGSAASTPDAGQQGAASASSKEGAASSSSVSGISSKNSASAQTARHRKSDAFIVSRCDKGLVSAVLVSPNNIVSSKTIAE